MPRACPVEIHARCYISPSCWSKDATGLSRGDSRSLLHKPELLVQRCHGLAPWRFTVAATQARVVGPKMPRACPVEIHACCYTARVVGPKMPRACPVEIHGRCYISPWHLWTQQCVFGPNNSALCSSERESPRGKPVASLGQQHGMCSRDRESPRGKPVASLDPTTRPCSSKRESPPDKPVASSGFLRSLCVVGIRESAGNCCFVGPRMNDRSAHLIKLLTG